MTGSIKADCDFSKDTGEKLISKPVIISFLLWERVYVLFIYEVLNFFPVLLSLTQVFLNKFARDAESLKWKFQQVHWSGQEDKRTSVNAAAGENTAWA